MITQHFILHIVPDEVRPRIYLSQRSTGLEKLQFTLVGTNGQYYSIPANTSVTMVGSKPDRKQFSYACTYSGNTVSCDVTDQMTAVAGIVTAELRFANNQGQVLPSQNMEIIVERSPLDGMVCSRNDFKSTDEEIASISQDAAAAKRAAQEAVAAGTAAVSSINSTKNSATTEINNTKNSAVSTVTSVASNAVSAANDALSAASTAVYQINSVVNTGVGLIDSTKDAAVANVNEAADTGINQLISYADDPNKVIYEYFGNTNSLRITALGSQGIYEEPNAVVYEYDDDSNTLTFTPSDS